MQVFFSSEVKIEKEYQKLVKEAAGAVAKEHKLAKNCQVSITIVDDATIKEINREYRGIDKVTDVISFALDEGEQPEIIGDNQPDLLGEIVLCLQKAISQAKEYGHSTQRELCYLTVHGMLHLLGFDHIKKADKTLMREQEEKIMTILGLKQDESSMFDMAIKARDKAYSPYSNFKVGAVVKSTDGDLFTGCNIENASYSLSLCAERVAIFKAISEGKKIKELLVVADTKEPVVPCGACLQVIQEFDIKTVVLANTKGDINTLTLKKLLPFSFSGENFDKKE